MTLQTELQINIVINNYTQRSGSYSANYDYLLLDNLASSSYSNLFRSDLKYLKIKTKDGTNCAVLYIPSYGSQPSAILVRVPVGKISQTTKLLLEVYDTSTSFSSTLSTGGEVLMFDANNDTYSQFFMSYSGLSINNDSTDGGRFLRARFVPNIEGTSQHHYLQHLPLVVAYQTIVLLSQDLKEFQDVLMLMIMQYIMELQLEHT